MSGKQKTRTTDGRTDTLNPVYPPNFVAGGIIIYLFKTKLYNNSQLIRTRMKGCRKIHTSDRNFNASNATKNRDCHHVDVKSSCFCLE